MAMNEEQDESGGIPEWVVTFGDMMSLLLTFFIMLVSMSEIKEEEKYQALVESFRKQFGHTRSITSMMPGPAKPRSAKLSKGTTMGRARRKDTHRGGNKVRAPVGDDTTVTMVSKGSRTAVGTAIFFDEDSARLSESSKEQLITQIQIFLGKAQKIEIRGHTSLKPVVPTERIRDQWDLANERARAVSAFFISKGIRPQRIVLSAVGPNEPVYVGTDPNQLKRNNRVEAYLLDSYVKDLEGTPEQREEAFTDEGGEEQP